MSDSSSAGDAPTLSLAQRGIRGAAWSYGGAGVVVVGQLIYTALTARLISPAEFGAYATAQALLMFVGYFTLGTVGNAIIRQPSIDRRMIGTALVLTGAAGALVSVVVVAAAGLWAELWRAPEAASLIRLYAPQTLLGGLAIVPVSLLRRDLRFRSATLVETSSVLVGFAVGAVLAWQLRDANALVLGQVAATGALFALGALATYSRLNLSYSRAHARSLFSFASQVSIQNLIHFVNNTAPSFVVSRYLGQVNLGFFSRASLLVWLPLTFLAQGVQKTLYPIYPRFRDNEDECRRMMSDVASVTTTMVWPLFAALAGLSPLVVEVLLGDQWGPVTAIVGPMCLYAAANFAYAIFGSFAEAFGFLRQIWLVQAGWAVVLVGALGIAVSADADMRTIVLVAAGVQVAAHVVQVALLARVRVVDAVATFRVELWAALLAAGWYLATTSVMEVASERALTVRIAVSGGAVLLLALATWLALPRLPAGKAFARRGIRISLRPNRSQPS